MEKTQRYRLCLSYEGTDFYGWQKQPQHSETVQGILESILSKIFNQQVAVVGSGRTDRGVHALNQWAHFDLPVDVDISNLQYKLRRMTPDSIEIKAVESAPTDFHAQISAESKCYKYLIQPGKDSSPFFRHFSWPVGRDLDVELLQNYAESLIGEHDFSSFQSQGTPVKTPVREIFISRWIQRDSGILEYQIQGSGFLKQMVRNIVGTMIKIEQNQAPADQFMGILESLNRQLAAAPAPPQGLFLSSVQYPKSLDNKCRKL